MITLYNKAADEYNNLYGNDDEWMTEEVDGKWRLWARETGTEEWVLMSASKNEAYVEKAKARRIEEYEFALAHPNGPMTEMVETGTTGHRFERRPGDYQVIRVRGENGEIVKREL